MIFKVYISGVTKDNAILFKTFTKLINQCSYDDNAYTAFNPCWLNGVKSEAWIDAIINKALSCSDVVMFLPGWETDEDCRIQMAYCIAHGKSTAELSYDELELPIDELFALTNMRLNKALERRC